MLKNYRIILKLRRKISAYCGLFGCKDTFKASDNTIAIVLFMVDQIAIHLLIHTNNNHYH